MTELRTGYDPDNDEYTIEGACGALGVSRATLDRHIPPGTEGRRRLTSPGLAGQVRISGRLVKALVPLPGGRLVGQSEETPAKDSL